MSSPTDLADLYAWYDSRAGRYDATSGGSVVTADNGQVARWEDQSGNGRHLTQGTSANRCRYDVVKNRVVSCVGPEGPNQYFETPASFTLDRRDFSIFFICEPTTLRKVSIGNSTDLYHGFCRTSGDDLNLHYSGEAGSSFGRLAVFNSGFLPSESIPFPGTLQLIGWVGTATEVTCYVNGSSTTIAALSAGNSTLTSLLGFLGTDSPSQCGYTDAIVYDRAITPAQVNGTLIPYAASRGVVKSPTSQLVVIGDSISHGYGSSINRGWVQRASLPRSCHRRIVSESGIQLQTLLADYASTIDGLLIPGITNVAVIFAGGNDIDFGGRTGAEAYADLETLTTTLFADGYDDVVWMTILDRNTFDVTQAGYRTDMNAAMVAGHVAAGATLVDVTTVVPGVPSYDGIHPNDAEYHLIADLFERSSNQLLPGSQSVIRRMPSGYGLRRQFRVVAT